MDQPSPSSGVYKLQALTLFALAAVAAAAGAVSIGLVHVTLQKRKKANDASISRPSGGTDMQSDIDSTAVRNASLRATSAAWSNALPRLLTKKPQELRGDIQTAPAGWAGSSLPNSTFGDAATLRDTTGT